MPSLRVYFPFSVAKAAEVAAAFLERAGGQINVMKLIKLVYLLDRFSLDQRGLPVVGGAYLSMKNGPVTSEVLDLINAGELLENGDATWRNHLEGRQDYSIRLRSAPERLHVSDGELGLIEEIWALHGGKDQWQLVDWCHANCAEWTRLETGSAAIPIGAIGKALGKSLEAINRIRQEASSLSFLEETLA